MNNSKRLLSILFIIAVAFTLISVLPSPAQAIDNIPYLDATGTIQYADNVNVLSSTGGTITDGWYLLSGSMSINTNTLTISGTVNLILEDNANIRSQIIVPPGNTLTIYAQSTGENMGYLEASGGGDGSAGIGGASSQNCGVITINGGSITATGQNGAASIGSGSRSAPDTVDNGGVITINGGDIRAGSGLGTGIGGGNFSSGGIIIINGGTVTARGSARNAAIGGGENGASGNITINGGTVNANNDGLYATGIGSGYGAVSGNNNITINDGTVNAYSSGGAAIGFGINSALGTITINNGTVIAVSDGSGAGIGGSGTGGGTITINDGIVDATSNGNGAAIGGGTDGAGGIITINNGTVNATSNGGGAGIGGGLRGDGGTILINGSTTQVTATGGNLAQDIGAGQNGAQGNVFVALPQGNLKNDSGNIGNVVQFTASHPTSDTVTATLPTPFSKAVNLITGLTTTGTDMSVITTFTTEEIEFGLSGYITNLDPITGDHLNTLNAEVAFTIPEIIIDTQPSSVTVLDGDISGNLVVAATLIPRDVSTLNYQW